MKAVVIKCTLLVFVVVSPVALCRKCWYCKNARSNLECLMKGRLEQCQVNQYYCQNEVRAVAGGKYFEITKRCKQTNACSNNQMQNTEGFSPFQCDTKKPHSVCRCCCGFDNCNGPEVACLSAPPTCKAPPDRPLNGYRICPSRLSVGASCYYRCDTGFKLIGSKQTQCQSNGRSVYWSDDPPLCIVEPCRSLNAPEEGNFVCSSELNIGSECTFSCNSGRVLIGERTIRCSIFSTWTDTEPECAVVTCPAPRPLSANFVPSSGVCTDGYNFGSVCTFACHPDYNLVGDAQIQCGFPISRANAGSWDKRLPRCLLKRCRPAHCPTNQVGDTCTFDCERCTVLRGSPSIQCTRLGWSDTPGRCIPVTCRAPPRVPANGSIQCSSSTNACDSVCRYSCNAGYRIVGSRRIACLPTGLWDGTAPICELSECDPIRVSGVSASCSDGRSLDSECTMSCSLPNHEFVGPQQVTCRKGPTDPIPKWEPEITQYCRPNLCSNFPPPGQSPRADVGSITCGLPSQRIENDRDGREGWRVGARCDLVCNEGYRAKRLEYTTECIARDTWTPAELCCVACTINSDLDLVVFLDSTEPAYWDARLQFLGEFAQFLTEFRGYFLNITIIPFGDDVDVANRVDFMMVDDDENYRESDFVEVAMAGVTPVAGRESNSGKALQYTLDTIFGFHDYRVPVIFLLTTRAPSDLAVARESTRSLLEKRIHLRILPITEPLAASSTAANMRIFQELASGGGFVLENTGDEEGGVPEFFYASAENDMVLATQNFCRSRTEDIDACQFAP